MADSPATFMFDEESSEEEQDKFFNSDREPRQPPRSSGCCLGFVLGTLLSLVLIVFYVL